nr:zeta toxin family protein [Massilia frigida]
MRRQIVQELILCDRLGSDEDICLGHGGSKPYGQEALAGACAYLVAGLPASGKSTLVSAISDRLGAMVLDSDFAKRKLPEFDHALAGAALVHDESRLLIFGNAVSGSASLLEYCMSRKLNVVIPLVGNEEHRLKFVRNLLIENGYQVHLTAMLLDRTQATQRALDRFLQTGRYISLGMIFDRYANDPVLNYHKAWMDADTGTDSQWASLGALAVATHPAVVHSYSSDANPAALWGQTP